VGVMGLTFKQVELLRRRHLSDAPRVRCLLSERLRIWELAFPKVAPMDTDIDLDALVRLDMTIAVIVGAAPTAALLARPMSTAPRSPRRTWSPPSLGSINGKLAF
jgi:hypothetical protein